MKARSTAPENPTIRPHLSRVLRIVNLGLQPGFTWEGKDIAPEYKIDFTFEIRDENMKDGRPFIVSREINNKDSDMSNLYQWAQACGTDVGSIDKMLDVPVMMTPREKKNGWITVDTIGGLPPALAETVTPCENELIIFDFTEEDVDIDIFDKLPELTQNKILQALDIKDYPFYAKLMENQL